MNTTEFLLKAKEEIQLMGWTKGVYESPDGCLCLYGAIDKVKNRYKNKGDDILGLWWHAQAELMKQIRLENLAGGYGIATFNDAQENVESVYGLIDRTIKRLSV